MKDIREDVKVLRQDMDRRFDQVIQRMERFMIWSFVTTLTVGGIVIAAGKLL